MSHRTGRGLVEWFLRTGTLSTVAWPINSHKCAWPIGCPARIGVTKPLDACLSVMDNKATKAVADVKGHSSINGEVFHLW